MFQVSKPSDEKTSKFLLQQSRLPFDYPYSLIGATRHQLPEGYAATQHRVWLGNGDASFAAAKSALHDWQQFPANFVDIFPAQPEIKVGTSVALRIRALGGWARAAARIVYTIDDEVQDERGAVRRFGFAYGTLPAHPERGEERFMVEWLKADDSVWYDLASFSRPANLFVWLGLPVARYYQRRFARKSAEAMARAVSLSREPVREPAQMIP